MAGEGNHERDTSGLRAHAQKKAQDTYRRVSDAIERLLNEEKPVNFNAVARAADVTKSYLYAQSSLRARIDALRLRQGQVRLQIVSAADLDKKRTEKGSKVLLEAKERRIRQLEEDVTRLREENKRLRGREYDGLR